MAENTAPSSLTNQKNSSDSDNIILPKQENSTTNNQPAKQDNHLSINNNSDGTQSLEKNKQDNKNQQDKLPTKPDSKVANFSTEKKSEPEQNQNNDNNNQVHGFDTTNYQPPTLEQLQSQERKRNLLIVCITVVILIGIYALFSWGFKQASYLGNNSQTNTDKMEKKPSKNALFGTINFTNPPPQQLNIVGEIYYRVANSQTSFIPSGESFNLQQNYWQINKLKNNVAYEVMAQFYIDNQKIAQTEVITAKTPSQALMLNCDQDWQKFISGGTITGNISIDGFMPPGSKVVIVEDVPSENGIIGQPAFTFNPPASVMSYTLDGISAINHHLYSAELYNSAGEKIGVSIEKIQAQVGDSNVNFTINSTAIPNVANSQSNSALLSGQVEIKGPLRANSRILVSGRPTDQGEFVPWQVLTNLSENVVYWQYSQAQENTQYQVQATLQVNGETVSSSQIVNTHTPQKNLRLSLSTNYFLSVPKQTVQIEACVLKGDAWETSIIIPDIDLAAQYWLEVGTSNNNFNLYSRKHADASGPLSIRVGNLSKGKKNFVRFSYAVCQGCTSDTNFSPWSKTLTFVCN